MSKTPKTPTYNVNDRAIVRVLTEASAPMTFAEIKAAAGSDFSKLNAGNLVSAMRKNLIASVGERDVEVMTKRTVATYLLVDTAIHCNAENKMYNYTDNEKRILSCVETCFGTETAFTLNDLAKAMNVERLTSGNINALVKKGNIVKSGVVTILVPSLKSTPVYAIKQIPESFNAESAE